MYAGRLQRYCAAAGMQHRLLLWPAYLPAIAFTLLVPLVFSLRNLDAYGAAQVLERFYCLVGVLLLVPLPLPEQGGPIRETVSARFTPQTGILALRLVFAVIALAALVLLQCGILLASGATFPLGTYWFGTFVSALVLGSVGLCVYVATRNWVAGYLAPATYFLLNTTLQSQLGRLNLFTLPDSPLTPKLWLLALGLLILAVTLAFHEIRRRTVSA